MARSRDRRGGAPDLLLVCARSASVLLKLFTQGGAPLWRPREHPVTWPTEFPEEIESWRAELDDSPVREYVLRLYLDHRQAQDRVQQVDATASLA